MKIYLLLFLSSLFASVGQIFLKKGSSSILNFNSFLNFNLLMGVLLYVVGFLIWVYCLAKVNLSMVYGFTLLTFIFVFFLSYLFLGEKISILSMCGLFLVFCGFYLIVSAQSNL